MKTYLSYRRTVSKNYQSETEEFGFEVVVLPGGGAHAKRAHDLCRAIVNHRLGQKIGLTRRQLDVLSKKFFNTPWQELTTGVAEGDEQL